MLPPEHGIISAISCLTFALNQVKEVLYLLVEFLKGFLGLASVCKFEIPNHFLHAVEELLFKIEE